MKNTLIISNTFCAALVFSVPAFAIELSANETRSFQHYKGSAQAVLDAGEAFEISSDRVSQTDQGSSYSGNVVVTLDDMRLEADALVLVPQKDGSTLLRTEEFSLFHADTK